MTVLADPFISHPPFSTRRIFLSQIGVVSLASFAFGTASSVTVEEFYKYPHCFSS